jgi:hypothetical protein
MAYLNIRKFREWEIRGLPKPFDLEFRYFGFPVKSGLTASFHYAVYLILLRGVYPKPFVGFTKLRFVVPTMVGVPKPSRNCFAVAWVF